MSGRLYSIDASEIREISLLSDFSTNLRLSFAKFLESKQFEFTPAELGT